jgi:tetratricopeptide (TPR) repeat protein
MTYMLTLRLRNSMSIAIALTMAIRLETAAATAGQAIVTVAQPDAGKALDDDERVSLNSRWDLGYYLFQMQEFGAAAKEFEKIRRILPDDPTLLALIGSCYSMSGHWSEGEKALLQAKQRNPDDEDINGLLGQFYLSTGKSLKGAAYLEHSLRVTPGQGDLRVRLANLYLEAGNAERARYHLEFLLRDRVASAGESGAEAQKGFGFPELDYAYARCLVRAGMFKEGLEFAVLAHQADPVNPRYARVYGLCLMGTHRYGEAAPMLAAGRNELQGEELIYLQWGEALFLDRRWEDAEKIWLEGVSRFPKSYDLMSRLVEYYISTAKPSKARRVVSFGESRNPGHPGNLLLEARLHRKLGQYAASWKTLSRLKRKACGPMANEAIWEEAQLQFTAGKYANCEKLLDKLLTGKHRKTEAHLMKAKLALYRGNKSLAQAQLLEAKETNPYDLKDYALAQEAFGNGRDGANLAAVLKDKP